MSPAHDVQESGASCAVIGGGYAGIATAIELHNLGLNIRVTLYDPRPNHQKITQWHKLARGESPSRYETPFAELARRFDFNFVQKHVRIPELLQNADAELGAAFDAVVIAQGSHSPAKPAGVLTLDALRDIPEEQELVRTLRNKQISVIGGGTTGVQFAFEFAARGNRVDIYEARDRLLPTFDHALGMAAVAAAEKAGIRIHLLTEFLHFNNGRIEGKNGERHATGEADAVLFVPGVRSTPAFTCDVYGRIVGYPNRRFYAAGDNSYFSGRGLNTKSAQAAVRKGQHAARTLVADLTGKTAKEYTYPELGYFVSLGPKNAVGYMLSQKTAFSGPAALFMKEAVEKQYNLYLEGLPVYP